MPYMTGRSASARPVLPSQLASQPVNPLNTVIPHTNVHMTTIMQRNDGTWYDTSTGKYLGNGSTPQGATQDNQGMWQSTPAPVTQQPLSILNQSAGPVPMPTGGQPRSYNRMTPRHAPAPQPGGMMNLAPQPPAPQPGGMMNLTPQPPAPAPAPQLLPDGGIQGPPAGSSVVQWRQNPTTGAWESYSPQADRAQSWSQSPAPPDLLTDFSAFARPGYGGFIDPVTGNMVV